MGRFALSYFSRTSHYPAIGYGVGGAKQRLALRLEVLIDFRSTYLNLKELVGLLDRKVARCYQDSFLVRGQREVHRDLGLDFHRFVV